MKFAILYPGQGSQKVGMGLDLYEPDEIKELFKKVNSITQRDISKIFLYGPEEELNQTKNTQLAIVTISIALTILLQQKLKSNNLNFNPFACAGHSLGEFTALWFLNVLSLENIIKLVSVRGNLMQTAPPGSMAAILNLSLETIKEVLSLSEDEYKNNLVIANYNSPTQYVISGKKELLEKIILKFKSLGGKAIILPTSGAFHSPSMEEPSRDFTKELEMLWPRPKAENTTKIPIYQNIDALPSTNYTTIKEKIKKQMTSPVLWTQTIINLVNDGVNLIIEIGPGKVLTGLVKKINPTIECYNIYDLITLDEFVSNYEHKLLSQSKEPTKTS